MVWNGSASDSTPNTPLLSTSLISPAYTITSTLLPSPSSPPATTTSTPVIKPTSLTTSVLSSSLSTRPSSLTHPGVPLPTTSTGVTVLVGSDKYDQPEEPPLVILGRRSQVCSVTAAIYNNIYLTSNRDPGTSLAERPLSRMQSQMIPIPVRLLIVNAWFPSTGPQRRKFYITNSSQYF
jgi:hypothetical protein